MEQSLISLLTPSADDSQHTPLPSSPKVPLASVQEMPSLREQFSQILADAELTLRASGKARIAEAEEQKREAALDEALGLKAPAPEGAELQAVVAGIAPPTAIIDELTAYQESVVAAVIFDQEVIARAVPDFHGAAEATLRDGKISVDGSAQDAAPEASPRLLPEDEIILSSAIVDADVAIEHDDMYQEIIDESGDDVLAVYADSSFVPVQEAVIAPVVVAPSVSAPVAATQAAIAPGRSIPTQPLAQQLSARLRRIENDNTQARIDYFVNHASKSTVFASAVQGGSDVAVTQRILPTIANAVTPSVGELLRESATFSPKAPTAPLNEQTVHALNPAAFSLELLGSEAPIRLQRPSAELAQLPAQQQMQLRITQALTEGQNRVLLQLFPEELGRVDIRMDIDRDNHASVRIITESREAYDLLRADKPNLERLLLDAGLTTDQDSMQFSHHSQEDSQHASAGQQSLSSGDAAREKAALGDDELTSDAAITDQLSLIATTGLNIKV